MLDNIADESREATTDNIKVAPSSLGTVNEWETEEDDNEESLPTQDEVVRKTEKITKKIQELLQSAQVGKLER